MDGDIQKSEEVVIRMIYPPSYKVSVGVRRLRTSSEYNDYVVLSLFKVILGVRHGFVELELYSWRVGCFWMLHGPL